VSKNKLLLSFLLLTTLVFLILLPFILAAEATIENVEDLLSTVSASDLGYTLLSIDNMKAEQVNTFSTITKLDYASLTVWIGYVQSSSGQDYLNAILEKLDSDELGILSVEHKAEVFTVKNIYSNTGHATNRTRVTIKVSSDQDVTGLRILELIPKSIAQNSSLIAFTQLSGSPSIIEQDPLIEWDAPLLRKGETKSFTYYLKAGVSKDEFRSISLYDKPKPAVQPVQEETNLTNESGQKPSEPAAQEDNEGGEESNAQTAEPKQFPWYLPFIVLVILLEAGAAAFFIHKRKVEAKHDQLLKKKLESKDLIIRPDLIIPYEKVRNVERFIENHLKHGKTNHEIKQELLSVGWDEHSINVIMCDVHVVDKKIGKLEHFIREGAKGGLSMDEIKTILMNIGWREDLVDLVLDDFRKA
jgi:hypothetical protein